MAEPQIQGDWITISAHDVLHILKSKNATEIHVMLALIFIEKDNKVSLPAAVRKEICEQLSISSQNFSNVLGNLKRRGWISGQDGQYTINTQ